MALEPVPFPLVPLPPAVVESAPPAMPPDVPPEVVGVVTIVSHRSSLSSHVAGPELPPQQSADVAQGAPGGAQQGAKDSLA